MDRQGSVEEGGPNVAQSPDGNVLQAAANKGRIVFATGETAEADGVASMHTEGSELNQTRERTRKVRPNRDSDTQQAWHTNAAQGAALVCAC